MNKIQALFTGFATVIGAGGIAAYNGVFDAPKPPAVVQASQPAKAVEKPVEVAKADPAAIAVEPAETRPAVIETEAAAAVALAPAFGLLRAEPDGSVLVAGQSQPDAGVELMSGSTVLGKVKAAANGDFAIVLTDPLKAGDYALVLRSTNPDGKVATSIQTATVSIPDKADGQVLALVEEPGKASRIITAPVAEKPAEVAVVTPPEPTKPAEVAASETVTPAKSAEAVAAVTSAEPEKPAEIAATTTAETPAVTPEKPAVVAVESAKPDVVAVEPAKPAGASTPEIAVEAVEIEGRKIFIAGSAAAGSTIRLYATDVLLGETKATENNRFLLETERDLAVGDYIIHADSIGPDGKVIVRAAVPFKREAGEAITAVAAAETPKAPAAGEEVASAKVETPAAKNKSTVAVPAVVEPVATAKAETPAAAETVATAPALTKVDSSVIIRRGDSLWRISRRIYGRGVRYSTIYLANKTQVEDPNRIWPGQVMMIPEKTAEGEAADMAEIEKRKADTANQ